MRLAEAVLSVCFGVLPARVEAGTEDGGAGVNEADVNELVAAFAACERFADLWREQISPGVVDLNVYLQ